jgi:hypothetical protein
MTKRMAVVAGLVAGSLGFLSSASAQTPERKFFAISAGTYTEVGGIWGVLTSPLPDARQALIELTLPPANNPATLTFWSKNALTPFRTLTNGIAAGNSILFNYITWHPYYPSVPIPATVDYVVTMDPGRLSLSGAIMSESVCCDIPYFFGHTNVLAVPIPVLCATCLSNSPGTVEIRWISESNFQYQVQSRAAPATGEWIDLGPVVSGTNGLSRVQDKIPPDEPQRFYRLKVLPDTP